MVKLWYIWNETFLHAKFKKINTKKELSSHEKTGTNLKYILLSEKNQSVKATYCMISTMRHSEKGKLWSQ